VKPDLPVRAESPKARRRLLLAGASAAALSAALRAVAQSPDRVHRIGYLAPAAAPAADDRGASARMIVAAMREMGYDPRNLVLEQRYADGKLDALPRLARELLQLDVDVVVAVGSAAIRAMKAATTSVPIVMFGNFDPVAAGLVANLARPGGNVTGVLIAPDGTLAGKKLQLLKEAVPQAQTIPFLAPDDPAPVALQLDEVRKAARALRVQVPLVQVRGQDYERAFDDVVAHRPGALFLAATTFFMRDRLRIIPLAARHRLPTIYEWREQVADGGLMAYGSTLAGTTKRIAAHVDRILRGANPGEIPVDQPTEFELSINLRTASAIGLVLPPALVARADVVIR
jgi:putative ABC transport system substrate-binding protein